MSAALYTEGQTLYRFDDSICGIDVYVKLERWCVVEPTPKGAWIRDQHDVRCEYKKWIPLGARFAQRTKEEALESFQYRKRSHVKHCKIRLAAAEKALEVATEQAELLLKDERSNETLHVPGMSLFEY